MISGTIRNREAIIALDVSAHGAPVRQVEAVIVVWHGLPAEVLILRTTGAPLVGMSLLDGNRITMDVVDGGDVTIDRLP
jgi:hypothetical protein